MAMAPTTVMVLLAFLLPSMKPTEAQIGVCYGMNGNNLPSPQDVVNLYKSKGIGAMRLYEPDLAALRALRGSGIKLILDAPNDILQTLGSNSSAAMKWVQTLVVPFASSIKYIALGNEVDPSDEAAPYVVPAMQNVLNAVNAANLGGQIKVTTVIATSLIVNYMPPSSAMFSHTAFMRPIVNFLKANGSHLMVNVYPYFAYANNEQGFDIKYALFTLPKTLITDIYNDGLRYQNLFDILVDSVYAALAKAGAPNITIVVSETGWPSDGGDAATVDNAGTYYKNLINHVKQGTPWKRQGIETYLFAMFDENLKFEPDNYFGLFTPAQQPKYLLSFN